LTSSVSFQTFGDVLRYSQSMVQARPGEQPWDYLSMIPYVVSPVIVAFAGLGAWRAVVASVREGRDRDLPALIWVAFYLCLISLRVDHNVSRYLWPLLPALVMLAVCGARWAWLRLVEFEGRLAVAVASLSLALILLPAVRQMKRDLHPFFSSSTQSQIADFILAHSEPGDPIYWSGSLVALAPPDPTPMRADETFDFFHLSVQAIRHLTGRDVERVNMRSSVEEFLASHADARGVIIEGPQYFPSGESMRRGLDPPETFRIVAHDKGEFTSLVLPAAWRE